MPHIPCDITFDEVVKSYQECRKKKRTKASALQFEINLEDNLYTLYKELKSGTYEIGTSICFVVKSPRVREVWAAGFRDRIVHHLVYNRLAAVWNKKFVVESCACIPERGTLYGAKRLEKHIRSFTQNYTKDGYYMKCDLSNFFVSIDKNILWQTIEPTIQEDWLKSLTKLILFHDPCKDYILNSDISEMEMVPENKRLMSVVGAFGLAIGNLTSQFFANIIMHLFDNFVKRVLRIKKYIRYVDDCIFLGNCPKELYKKQLLMIDFLKSINMKFNPKKCFIQPISRGVSFVGQTIYPFRRVVLRNTQERCEKRLSEDNTNIRCFLGYFQQANNSYRLVNKIVSKYGEGAYVPASLCSLKQEK